jgi:hypothetical protein
MALKLDDRVRTKVQVEVRGPGAGDAFVNYVVPIGAVGQIVTIYTTGRHRISVAFAPDIYPFEGILYDAEELTKLRATSKS